MKKSRIALIVLVCIGIFFLVYFPHVNYKWPLHVDEWYHISETLKLKGGEYVANLNAFRVGFDLFLLPFSYIFDLVKVYQYFPALWVILTTLVLFWIVYRKSDKDYLIALFAMIFFASLKSNVNIGGLWFFIPFVFAIPFIYLFVYFYSEGIEKQNKRFILYCLGIAVLLLFIHTASLLFMIPFIFVYALFNYKYILKEWKFFFLFLLIPLIGIFFYSGVKKINLFASIGEIFYDLQFKYGRMPLELNNSFFEVYSPIGYVLAFLGVYYLISNYGLKKNRYMVYFLWPLLTLVSIIIFKIFGISFFAPYQRTMYYFAISLPLLSAFGVYYLFKIKDKYIDRNNRILDKQYWKKFAAFIIIASTILLTFYSYNNIPGNVQVYHLIDNGDYSALLYLKNQSSGVVLSSLGVGSATYAVSEQKMAGALFFYGNKNKTQEFLSSSNCTQQSKLIRQLNVSYVLAKKSIDCNWTIMYNHTNLIYNVRNISNPIKKVVNISNKTINVSKI